MRHVIITRGDSIFGVLRVNTALRHGREGSYTSLTLGEFAIRQFTTAGIEEVMFDVIGRMMREHAALTIVFNGLDRHVGAVAGLITKEHLADSVSASIGPFASGEASALL